MGQHTRISGIVACFYTVIGYYSSKENGDIMGCMNAIKSYFAYNENASDLSQTNEYYNQGLESFRMGEFVNALERYNMALDEYEYKPVNVDKARIQYAIGLTHKKKGNLGVAIQWYLDAIGTLNSLAESEEIRLERSYVQYLRGNAYLDSRDLERAQLDCDDCLAYLSLNESNEKCTYATALCLKGRIYTASYYGTHSKYPVHGGVDLGVSWLDAMNCFEDALGWNGMRLRTANSEVFSSGNNSAVKSFKDIEFSGLTMVYEPIGFEMHLGDYYWLIENPDAETAAILNYRSTLLLIAGLESAQYLNEAEAESEIALRIYNDLQADRRDGIQYTYFNLATAVLFGVNAESEDHTINMTIAETYCEQIIHALEYTKKW